ncbi:MAG: outer membrane lipoprotein carrier protein LolA [Spirochaetia bacterium]|nr:outer membrane lipoprotein carrier protein LolA [Spirochaetia bacterium]
MIFADKFLHPNDVVSVMKEKFKNMKSYEAQFNIQLKEKNKTTISTGTAYYEKGGKINFTFKNPQGDLIISNGKKMWVYIASLKAVGIQELDSTLKGKSIYEAAEYEGLVNLFRRYHYRFESPKQPVSIKKNQYYVLYLEEKEKSGGFEKMIIYVDTKTYLIQKVIGTTPSGREVTLEFNDIELNKELSGNLFNYKLNPNDKVVENPLVTE